MDRLAHTRLLNYIVFKLFQPNPVRLYMFRLVLGLLLLVLSSPSIQAERLTLYSEEFPPFNYTHEGKFTGAATEIVEANMKIAEQDYAIKSYPWARSFHNTQVEKNAFIYSISRRQKRESLFKWVGVLAPANQSVFALKKRTDISIHSLDDMKAYTIGTTLEDSRESYLVSQGFDISTFERIGGNTPYHQLFLQLKRGRIDLWPMPNAVMKHIVLANNEDPSRIIKQVFKLEEISQEGYYLAASLTTSDEIIFKLRKALKEFKQSKAYADIIKKWGL